jgi:hypothetical protein
MRRFPPPWPVEEPDAKLDRRCFIARDANGQALVEKRAAIDRLAGIPHIARWQTGSIAMRCL